MPPHFDHEKLQAYQAALEFFRWSEAVMGRIPKAAAVSSQLDRARTSIPLNIAEGNVKFTPTDKCRYLDIAHGSTVECAACLDLLFIKQRVSESDLEMGKKLLSRPEDGVVGVGQKRSRRGVVGG